MKLKEFYKTPAGEILAGLGEGAAITAAALGLYALTKNDGSQITIGVLATYLLTDPASRIGLGVSDIFDNTNGRKRWNDARF
jgi:hypothetical protein